MVNLPTYCVYYSKKDYEIIDFLPQNIDNKIKAEIIRAWSNPIMRKILIYLSENEEASVANIKNEVGHSMSTLHEAIQKLHETGLISSDMIYEGKKQKIIKTNVLFVTHNPKLKRILKEALNQGLWVDSAKTKQIIDVLDKHPKKYFSIEELSTKTKIPVDEIKILLENFDSQITRALSDFMKKRPFEKKVFYTSNKNN